MEKSQQRRWWILGALAIGILAVGLDLTILNLALPTIAADLDASNGDLQWFADAYNLALAAALLPAGLIGDRLGRKAILIIGMLLFGLASVVCAYADSIGVLIAGRAVLGIGAAMLIPLSMSIIPILFSEQERSKAIGVWMMANAIGIPLGPIVGGWLLNHYGWGSVFLINIPLILVGLIAVIVLLPESRAESNSKVDVAGILLSSGGLVGLTWGIIEIGARGWTDVWAWAALGIGVLLLVVLIFWERSASAPLIDLSLFRSASFTWGTVLATIATFSMFGVLFVIPQFLQAIVGTDAWGAGLRLLPLIVGLLIGSQVSDRLQPQIGTKYVITIGFLLLAIGLACGAITETGSSYVYVSIWVTIIGLGIGFVMPAAMDAAMSALSAEGSGVGSALIMALRNVGGTMGVAILGTILSTQYSDKLDSHHIQVDRMVAVKQSVVAGVTIAKQMQSEALLTAVRSSFIYGMEVLMWVCFGIALIGMGLTLIFLRLRMKGSVELE